MYTVNVVSFPSEAPSLQHTISGATASKKPRVEPPPLPSQSQSMMILMILHVHVTGLVT